MKRLISLLTCLALLPFLTGAAFPFSFWKTPSGSATYHLVQNQGSDDTDDNGVFGTSVYEFYTIVASSSYNVRRVSVRLSKTGSPPSTYVAQIWTSNGGSPPSPLVQVGSDSTNSLTSSSLTTSFAEAVFTFPIDIALTSGTTYHVVLHNAGTADDASNLVNWSGHAGGSGFFGFGTASPGWIAGASGIDGAIKTYSFF